MADDADRAQPAEEAFRKAHIEARRAMVGKGVGTIDCVDCGEEIPENRRKARAGCTRCVDCQADYEDGRT